MAAVCLAATVLNPAQPAKADGAQGCNQEWWPTTGAVSTHSDSRYESATFSFKLNQTQVNNLRCVAQFVEIDFHLEGKWTPPEWDDYIVAYNNLPGAIHDVAANDFFTSTPGVTRVQTASLQAGVNYSVTIAWSPLSNQANPGVWVAWVPSHWASDLAQQAVCNWGRVMRRFGDAWCIFPYKGAQDATYYYRGNTMGVDRLPFGGNRVVSFGGWVTGVPSSIPLWPQITSELTLLPYLSSGPGGGSATYDGVIRINGTNGLGVKLRAAPNTLSGQVGGLAEGTVVHPTCYARGENYGGTNLWWKVGNGFYSSFFDTVPYDWQNAIESHYGIQRCDVLDTDKDGILGTNDACPNQAGLPLFNGCPPPQNRRDVAWYDDRTLWGFKSSGLHTVAERQGFGRPDWAGVGDYDHDGREDLFWYHETSTTIYVILGGDFTRVIAARGPGIGRPVWASTGDFDGNGFRDEIAWYDGTMLFLLRGQGLHTVYETAGYSRPDWAGVGDQNQDGKDDLFWYHGGGNGTIYAITSNGGGFNGAYAVRGPGIGAPQWAGVGDFDGNGRRNDLAWFSGGWLFTLTGPSLVTTGERHGYSMNDWAGVGKCDNSGRDSLFWYHGGENGTIYCIHNNGSRFTDASVVRGPGVGQPVWAGTGDIYP